jgi:hypothetical protein
VPVVKPRTQEDYDREVRESAVAALAEKLFVANYGNLGGHIMHIEAAFRDAEAFLKEAARRRDAAE